MTVRINKHKKFDQVLPYTYLIKHKPTGLLYHGVRYSNLSKNRTPNNDFSHYYFGSSVTFKDIFSLSEFNKKKDNYAFRLCWTFDSVDDAFLYEENVNRKVLQRNILIQNQLIQGSRFANNCYGKAIAQTEEVREKQRKSHNSICDCGCGLTRAQCNAIKSSATRKNDICKCGKIPECNGDITTYQCAGLRCRDQRTYELIHYKTKNVIKGTQVELSEIIGCQTSHINSLLNDQTGSAYGFSKLGHSGGVRVLNEMKTIMHSEKGSLSGTISELALIIEASESHVGMLFNKGAKKVKKVKGWYNPFLNKLGEGGYGSGSKKNRWWQNLKKQNTDSLALWKDINDIHEMWINNNKPGYLKFTQIVNDNGYLVTRKRIENVVKLFRDEAQFCEMLSYHVKTDFGQLIAQKVS